MGYKRTHSTCVGAVIAGITFRALLFSWGWDSTLRTRFELITPVSSTQRLMEGLWLRDMTDSAYSGDGFHGPPLVLSAADVLLSGTSQVNGTHDVAGTDTLEWDNSPERTRMALFFVLLDACIAMLLYLLSYRVAFEGEPNPPTPRVDKNSPLATDKLLALDVDNGFNLLGGSLETHDVAQQDINPTTEHAKKKNVKSVVQANEKDNKSNKNNKNKDNKDNKNKHKKNKYEKNNKSKSESENEKNNNNNNSNTAANPHVPGLLGAQRIANAVVVLYMLNPLSILSCVAMSLSALDHFFLTLAWTLACPLQTWQVWQSTQSPESSDSSSEFGGKRTKKEHKLKQSANLSRSLALAPVAAVALAVACYLRPFHLVQLVPICFMITHKQQSLISRVVRSSIFVSSFIVAITILLYASVTNLPGTHSWMQHSYVWELTADDLSPNIGLWWYFFTELFGRFRPYFLFLYNVHPYIYVLPLTIQLSSHRPALLGQLLFAIAALFRAYPDLSGLGMVMCCASMHPLALRGMDGVAHTSLGVIGPLALLPVMSFMWLEAGSGNANYYYFQALVFQLFSGALVLEWLAATVRRDRLARKFRKHPGGKWWLR